MIFHPPVLALLLASALSSGLVIWASVFARRLLGSWDLSSGSEAQLRLERQTYLVSTLLAFVMAVELASLVLFVFNADRMAVMFVGAMCAVGTLNASIYGFPALFAKIAVFFAAGLWLAVNHADSKGRDYPLVRIKYRLQLGVAPLVLLAAALQLAYFLDLKADTITSCCGKMFTLEKAGIAGEMVGIGEWTAMILLYSTLAVVLAAGMAANGAMAWMRIAWRNAALITYGAGSVILLGIALTAVVSAVSLYVYEHPHHHCPFCLLKREYGYFGFLLYAPLFAGTSLGFSASFLGAVCRKSSLQTVLPVMLRRFVHLSMASFTVFGALSAWAIISSKLVLFP